MESSNDREEQFASSSSEVSIEVTNVGGIDSTDLRLSPGVTILTGQNATNRTSLLRAAAGGLGGTAGVLKRDADRGHVSMTIGGETYERRYERTQTGVRTEGNTYSDADELIDLFVCLLEDNALRRAVRAGDELADLLLAPIDTETLTRQINELQSERTQLDEQLNEIERDRKRLPALEQKRTELENRLEEITANLDAVRSQLEPEASDDENVEHAESVLERIEELRIHREETKSELETQRSIRDELAGELETVQESLSEIDVREAKQREIQGEIERLQGRESELSKTITELSTIRSQNRQVLDGESKIVSELAVSDETIDRLDPMSQSIECWTCGSDIERQAITARLDELERLVESKRNEREELRETLAERRSRYDSIQRRMEKRQELRSRKADLERELERRSESIETLAKKADRLREEVSEHRETLESIDTIADETHSDYERLSELEYNRGQTEQELRELEDEITEIEYRVSKSTDLETRRGDITERITSLRSRAETIERDVIETFNTHSEAVLDRLAYENIERVWIERRTHDDKTTFPLHIVRTDDDGTAYEDEVTHLSESEREVVGLVVALAGYLTHDVQEVVPMILLDSLEAIDADRIAELIDYFRSHVEYLVLALLHEDAAVLPESYDRVYAEESLA
ncbi:chromosome segregation protein SMC [Natrarchaeobius halalkaliphilus]|uniref:Chromosome segregation protein SMC n=1 Tax=Natrarchaeobius halalkaliphilus TaxID=1679091 RepID=A0A3N6LXJ0_9EURY|nr:archaea-specific SMC-related protein [Natrarchaeobius halalkaliphilus]RQG86781.1 chromosome segregation protein SMC [Natrarchaeobius halalkaliphilus]